MEKKLCIGVGEGTYQVQTYGVPFSMFGLKWAYLLVLLYFRAYMWALPISYEEKRVCVSIRNRVTVS